MDDAGVDSCEVEVEPGLEQSPSSSVDTAVPLGQADVAFVAVALGLAVAVKREQKCH